VPIADTVFENLIDKYKEMIVRYELTYFEALTFLACVYFAEAGCGWVVLETGMGGRLDATNFCTPAVSVITPISYDHTKYLGSTLTEIAREKAGIIKPGVPAVVSPQPEEAFAAIEEAARANNSTLFPVDRIAEYTVLERSPGGSVSDIRLNIGDTAVSIERLAVRQTGDVYVTNFLTALASVIAAGVIPDETAIRSAAAISIPGRMERIGGFVLDVAHNDISFEALFDALGTYYGLAKYDLHIGILADKEIERVAEIVVKHRASFRNVTVFDFETGSVRKSGGGELFPLLKEIPGVRYNPSPEGIVFEGGAVQVMTGSFYGYPYMKRLALAREGRS